MEPLLIRRNRIVHLSLHVTDVDSGETIEKTEHDGQHFVYLHGHENLVPALEDALSGQGEGYAFSVRVDQACGKYVTDARKTFDRAYVDIPPDSAIGDRVTTTGPDGTIELTIVDLDDHRVTLDGNHPLAGRTLEYTGRVLKVLRAHKDEIRHHRPHPAGHHLMVQDSSFNDKLTTRSK